MEHPETTDPTVYPPKWETQKRQVKDLVPLENNPFGKIDSIKLNRLKEKIESLGIFEIPTIDVNNDLLTFNKRYHILMSVGRSEEEIDVRVPDRPLTELERKQIIINSNVHEGEWDRKILEDVFADIDIESLGIDTSDWELPAELQEEEKKPEPTYPIVQEFSEKHDAFIIVSDNEIDSNFIKEVLQLEQVKDYKSSSVGQSHVINANEFLKLWKSRS